MQTEQMKILTMIKDGQITPEQGTQLLEALRDDGPKSNTRGTPLGMEGLGEIIQSTVSKALGAVNKLTMKDGSNNEIVFSKTGGVGGANYIYEGNSINLSKMNAISLTDSRMVENSVNMSKIEDLALESSEWNHNSVNASSVKDSRWNRARWSGVDVNATKLEDASFEEGCEWNAVSLNTAKIKDSVFQNVKLKNVELNFVKFEDLVLKNIALENLSINAAKLKDGVYDGNEALLAALGGMVSPKESEEGAGEKLPS